MGKKKKTLTGRLLMVQETRFRISATNGQVHLLTLSRSCLTNGADLLDYLDEDLLLAVEYEGESNLGSAMVKHIRVLQFAQRIVPQERFS